MYQIVRNIHLFLGLFCFLFILIYGISSVKVAHQGVWSSKPTITESEVIISPKKAPSARALAKELMDHHNLRGMVRNIRKTDTGFRLVIFRTGHASNIRYNTETGHTQINTRTTDFGGMLQAVHFGSAGIATGYWLQNLWGAFVILVSTALIILGGTGVYMWFKIHTERLIGTILLTVGLVGGLTLTVLLYIA